MRVEEINLALAVMLKTSIQSDDVCNRACEIVGRSVLDHLVTLPSEFQEDVGRNPAFAMRLR